LAETLRISRQTECLLAKRFGLLAKSSQLLGNLRRFIPGERTFLAKLY
jgi:hypothetical protein